MKKLLTLLCALAVSAAAAAGADFQSEIRPLLSDKCFACHGPGGKPKAGLRLDSYAAATDSARKGGPAIVPRRPDKSLLIKRIFATDPDELMPPPESHKELSTVEREWLRQWIAEGAEYPAHWSLLPVKETRPPKVKEKKWSDHPVDRFVYARLARDGKTPSPAADRRTLIRRVTFDLTGLPPSREEIRQFLEDREDGAYERLVDRLLKSQHYGEHMARYWLDLVRYSDTHGLHADDYREIYKYRDWVIRSFNRNQPFDQFTVEQVAGDLLPSPSTDQLVASGFNRLNMANSAGSALAEELYVNNVVDRVNAIGTVYLGLTVGCAQCHDHKYDPISQREYYQLFAFFNNVDGLSHTQRKKSPPPFLSFPSEEQSAAMADLQKQIKEAGKNRKLVSTLRKKLAAVEKTIPTTMIMKDRSEIRPAFIYMRGHYDQPGEKVQRAVPAAFAPIPKDQPRNRLGLARWLVAPEHPLTARVAVNRFWQQCFGVGLVKTAEDFGSQGEPPSHPRLLDHLAHRFVASGWDVKGLMRHIVTSRTYRQTSVVPEAEYRKDPENRLLARGPRFRLDAEMIRDQALAVSGLLNRTMFGRSVKPPQPEGLWKSVALSASNTKQYVPDKGTNTLRRSIYTFWKRSIPHPAMTIFDAPTRETCVARRERTNTPLQALVLMNEPQYFACATELARQVVSHGGAEDRSRIRFTWELLTGRVIDNPERGLVAAGLNSFRQEYRGQTQVKLGAETVSAEEAAWAMLINSLLNLDIVKTKQ